MADELDAGNKFLVCVSGAHIVLLKPLPRTLSKEDAPNLAAWLVALADDGALYKFLSILETLQKRRFIISGV
jgi:hypothetical protein